MTDRIFFETENTGKKDYPRTRFLTFNFGTHRIRILSAPEKIFTHFFRGKGTIKCLGSDCPVCKNNKALAVEFPDSYTKKSGYNGSSLRHYANVLDRTVVKTCHNCGEESAPDLSGSYPPACPKCQTFLTEVTPAVSDKVKVINISQTNAGIINEYASGVLDEEGNPLGITAYDFVFLVNMAGAKKTITPMPDKDANDPVEISPEFLFDLSKVVIELTPEEIVEFMRGVTLKDIFAARRPSPSASIESLDDDVVGELNSSLNELFEN